ncbi:YjiH family protein [Virgibacillus necropolis]|uniref:Histidine transporter n=1 Tax=Virgibacillus necropolis TaxID=163877 RepID=A0A221MEV9_9BACI|nr:YjiH family protein [Virgibacillus necropolis]ASN06187.1 histidine transporter [Virgibacillus necropolis]
MSGIEKSNIPEDNYVQSDINRSTLSPRHFLNFFVFSSIGIFMFFVPIEVNGKSSIPLDHLISWIRGLIGVGASYYALLLVILGAAYPFYKRTWNKNKVEVVISVFKVLGAVATFLVMFEMGPGWLMAENMGPYWLNLLLIPIGLLVPIGAIFLALLVGYGLLEFIGVIMQPIMRPIWKTPGRSAIDAVASFVGSYSIGLLITNRVYKEGKYSKREATIIATGFSTVSATFMVVVAKTLDLMHIWNLYFWVTFLVTFIVTAITVRIWPLNKISDDYYTKEGYPEDTIQGNRIKHAWQQAMITAQNAPSLRKNIFDNLKDGLLMAMAILPTIMSVGLLGFILVNHTSIFDYVGYIFYPLTLLLQIPEPFLAAKAATVNLIDMFVPSLVVLDTSLETRFIIGSLSISAILFFSSLIPCILSTEIPIKLSHMIAIWFVRTVFTLLIVTPIVYLIL